VLPRGGQILRVASAPSPASHAQARQGVEIALSTLDDAVMRVRSDSLPNRASSRRESRIQK
jgi:hypothetical protein